LCRQWTIRTTGAHVNPLQCRVFGHRLCNHQCFAIETASYRSYQYFAICVFTASYRPYQYVFFSLTFHSTALQSSLLHVSSISVITTHLIINCKDVSDIHRPQYRNHINLGGHLTTAILYRNCYTMCGRLYASEYSQLTAQRMFCMDQSYMFRLSSGCTEL